MRKIQVDRTQGKEPKQLRIKCNVGHFNIWVGDKDKDNEGSQQASSDGGLSTSNMFRMIKFLEKKVQFGELVTKLRTI